MINQYKYSNTSLFQDIFINSMKEQEKLAIISLSRANRQAIYSLKNKLENNLNKNQEELKDLSTKTIVNNLQEALIGKTANAAKAHLNKQVFQPTFENPIK